MLFGNILIVSITIALAFYLGWYRQNSLVSLLCITDTSDSWPDLICKHNELSVVNHSPHWENKQREDVEIDAWRKPAQRTCVWACSSQMLTLVDNCSKLKRKWVIYSLNQSQALSEDRVRHARWHHDKMVMLLLQHVVSGFFKKPRIVQKNESYGNYRVYPCCIIQYDRILMPKLRILPRKNLTQILTFINWKRHKSHSGSLLHLDQMVSIFRSIQCTH